MADNHITINRASAQGNELLSNVIAFRSAYSRLAELKKQLDNQTPPANWTVIETQFGIPTGKGETMYNLVAGALSALDASFDFNNLLNYSVPK